ncbi:MAG: guanylate kinase [Alphaproteobacteria bacterium]|jgi:guanylate kinase|nr:guanylate kinase [Alphaproteobacteria bacterium]
MSSEGPRRRRGLMLVLSSPSGAGKTTLTRMLTRDDAEVELSVSWTTRPPRQGEIDGAHYYFVTRDAFRAHRAADGFLEWAEVHDNFYGSPRAAVTSALKSGRDVLFDIDWQGAQQLTNSASADVVKVFILPPSMKDLRARLESRAQDSSEVIKRRLSNAYSEISRWDGYDYVLVNEDLGACYDQLRAIITAERLRRQRQPWLPGFVQSLLKEDT